MVAVGSSKARIATQIDLLRLHDKMPEIDARPVSTKMARLPVFPDETPFFSIVHMILVEQHNDPEVGVKGEMAVVLAPVNVSVGHDSNLGLVGMW